MCVGARGPIVPRRAKSVERRPGTVKSGSELDLRPPQPRALSCERMHSIGRRILRTIVVCYSALLIVGAWPYRDVTLIGPAASQARRVLGSLSVRSGMEIFNAGEPRPVEWKQSALCHRLVGTLGDGTEEAIYDRPCPEPGPRVGSDSFEALLQRLSRATADRRLLERTPSGKVEHRSPDVRRFIALGDWLCRADDASLSSVRLLEQRQFRSYTTGAYRTGPVLECVWYCDERPAPLPRCSRLPADTGAALIGVAS